MRSTKVAGETATGIRTYRRRPSGLAAALTEVDGGAA